MQIGDLRNRQGAEIDQTHEELRHELFAEALDDSVIGKQVDSRSLFDINQFPGGVKFVRRHHGQCRMHALAHFRVGHVNSYPVIRLKPDPGRDIAVAAAGKRIVGAPVPARTGGGIADQHAAACNRGDEQKLAPVQLWFFVSWVIVGSYALASARMALRTLG